MLAALLFSVAAAEVVDAALPLVLASSEITAMGGSGLGFASGASGLSYTPAAPALRRITSTGRLDGTASFSRMAAQAQDSSDLTNAGPGYLRNSDMMIDTGATGRIDRLGSGIGITGVQVLSEEGYARIADGRFAIATGARDGRIAAGVAARVAWAELGADNQVDSFMGLGLRAQPDQRFTGLGAEAGVSFAPETHSWRLGLSARSPVTATPNHPAGSTDIDAIRFPWQAAIGGGWANAAARDTLPEGRAIRVGADVVVYGPVEDGVSLAPLLNGAVVPRGRTVSVSPRVGGELEVWPQRLRLRAGSYIEPSRSQHQALRLHGTGGLELRVLHVRLLRGIIDHDLALQSAFDLSERYQRVGWLGLSFWDVGVVSADTPPADERR